MKGAQAAMMVCLLNVGVLGAGATGAYSLFQNNTRQIDVLFDADATPAPKGPDWRDAYDTGAGSSLVGLGASRLSPIKRPDPPIDNGPEIPLPVVKLTDDELRAELEKFLKSKFTLKRVVHSTASADNCAFLIASDLDSKAPPVFIANGAHFPAFFGKHDNPSLRVLAKYDIRVRIDADGVTFTAPSVSEPTKFFDVRVEFTSAIPSLGRTGELPRDRPRDVGDVSRLGDRGALSGVKETPGIKQPATRKESDYEPATDTWLMGTDDFEAFKKIDLAGAVRVVVDRDGKPMGLQITDDVKDDHILAQRGAKRGDIIKAVNGKPVRSLAEARTVITKEVDAGVSTFVISYERDGLIGTKTFKK
ncbi:MAG: hypothetical protein IT462_01740 [Planctomycetes bacterium]|nr:hypothetical protein [Planctomycetota bacterium]